MIRSDRICPDSVENYLTVSLTNSVGISNEIQYDTIPKTDKENYLTVSLTNSVWISNEIQYDTIPKTDTKRNRYDIDVRYSEAFETSNRSPISHFTT